MLSPTFGAFLAIVSLVLGVLVLTGNGDFLLKNSRYDDKNSVYDKEKMEKASGIMLIVFGVLTGIDCFTTTAWAKIAYMVAILACFLGYIVYLRTKCKKQ